MSRSCCSIWSDEEAPRRTSARSAIDGANAASDAAVPAANDAPALMASDWLALAASPTFAAMALLTGVMGGPAEMCSSTMGMPLGGMMVMYLLMSAFHLTPWLRLVRTAI
ncbi:hypothetical protein ACFWXH_16895 [Mesorhizobium sp. NPDC059054]|uniref:hypothetical protein n=1 Tax=Mesorhizobium sp. NPDC059054 TaxID=3346711 RepID=UPI003691A688